MIVLVLVAVEPLAALISYTRVDGIPQIYDRVAQEPDAVIAELPPANPRVIFLNTPYMLNATVYWKPLVNGYSGFIPASFYDHYEKLSGFPDAAPAAALQAIGVTHVFAHRDALGAGRTALLDRTPGLRRIAEDGDIAGAPAGCVYYRESLNSCGFLCNGARTPTSSTSW